jgi:hypothetical protein
MKQKKRSYGHFGDDGIKLSPNTTIIKEDLNQMRNCSTSIKQKREAGATPEPSASLFLLEEREVFLF